MNIPKKDLKAVEHPDYEVHNFFSLKLRTGYSTSNIHMLYANGKINVFLSHFTSHVNMMVIHKDEIARLKSMKDQYGEKSREWESRKSLVYEKCQTPDASQ